MILFVLSCIALIASASGFSFGCPLQYYHGSEVRGLNGLKIQIDPGFQRSMNSINFYAWQCRVKVVVFRAFQRRNQIKNRGRILPVVKYNHLVGHAIGFKLKTPQGWCNGRCLKNRGNKYGRCFTHRVASNPNLRWGKTISHPVFIDDNLYRRNHRRWMYLFYKLQLRC